MLVTGHLVVQVNQVQCRTDPDGHHSAVLHLPPQDAKYDAQTYAIELCNIYRKISTFYI